MNSEYYFSLEIKKHCNSSVHLIRNIFEIVKNEGQLVSNLVFVSFLTGSPYRAIGSPVSIYPVIFSSPKFSAAGRFAGNCVSVTWSIRDDFTAWKISCSRKEGKYSGNTKYEEYIFNMYVHRMCRNTCEINFNNEFLNPKFFRPIFPRVNAQNSYIFKKNRNSYIL